MKGRRKGKKRNDSEMYERGKKRKREKQWRNFERAERQLNEVQQNKSYLPTRRVFQNLITYFNFLEEKQPTSIKHFYSASSC